MLTWLDQSALALWVRESQWGYPIVLSAHVIGMAAVVGTALMFGLWTLGYGRRAPPQWLDRFFTVAWFGFALNFLSGVALFVADAGKFLTSTAFQIKIAMIVAGGISIWIASRSVAASSGSDVPGKTKIVAALSMVFWLSAIVAGRLIAYTT